MRTMPAAPQLAALPRILRAAFLGVLLSALFPLAAAAAITYVDRNAPGPTHDGTSWATAYTALRHGLLAARTRGGEVWVAEGVYYPDDETSWDNSRFSHFELESGTHVYGGFDPAAGADTMEERNPSAHVTVLSGDLQQNDVVDANGVTLDWTDIVGTDNAYNVAIVVSNATVTLDGLTITAGLQDGADGYTSPHAGAGLTTVVSSNVTLNKVIFRGNRAYPQNPPINASMRFDGGAAYFSYSIETLTDVAFIGNSACAGGGAYSMAGTMNYTRVVFQDNDASRPGSGCTSNPKTAGGGLFIEPASHYPTPSPVLQDVQFNDNSATEGGGGLYANREITLTRASFNGNTGGGMADHGCSNLTDVTFSNNTNEVAGGMGGGIKAVCTKGSATYQRVTFISNTATQGAGLFFNRNAAGRTLDLNNAVFAGNQATGEGGGIYVQSGANNELRLTNAVLRGNEAASGGGIYGFDGCAALSDSTIAGNRPYGLQSTGTNCNWIIGNSILWGNDTDAIHGWATLTAGYSVIQGGCPAGATCDHVLSVDPAFRTPVPIPAEDNPTTAGDVHLTGTSLAIDAGNNALVPAGITVDLEQQSRFVDTVGVADSGSGTPPIVDIGAYEYAGPNQAITFLNPGPQDIDSTPTLTATASSGLPVEFSSSTTSVCAITSGGTLTFFTIGTCTIDADQPGNLDYTPAPTVTQSFIVHPVLPGAPLIGAASAINGRATVTFSAPAYDGGSPVTVYSAKSDPGGIIGTGAASPITVYGLTNGVAYTFTVRATNAAGSGDPSTPSNSVTPAAPQSQTITFNPEPASSYDVDATPTLTATASSGLPVTFTSSTPTVCTITSGGALTFLRAGTCTIDAGQSGLEDFYLPAPTQTRSFTVNALPQTITFVNPGAQTFGTSPILTATATSGLPVSFNSSTGTVCTTGTGGALAFLRAGTCIINADQPGNGSYLAAPRVTQSFIVSAVVPNAPWGVVAAPENAAAIVQFGVPIDGGVPITSYTVTSNPHGLSATAASSPITVPGLTNGVSYTFTVIATNLVGDSAPSAASNAVTPIAGIRIHVDRNAAGANDGSSWENAYTKLQDGLHDAAAGDEIWVAEGVYYPDEGAGMIDNKVDQYFWLPSGVKVYGGFDGADRAGGGETLLSQRDWTAHKTILSADIDQNDTNNDGNLIAEVHTDIVGSNADGVIEASNTNAATRLDGFVITGGNARATGSDGGGIWANQSRATYTNLEVRGNTAYAYGAGMFEADGAVLLDHVLFSGNDAQGHYLGADGGGYLHLFDGHPVFVDVTFSNNTADFGGGLSFQNGAGTLIGCTFTNNSARNYGGAINAWDAGRIELDDTTVSGNSAERGGGIYMFRSGTLIVRNSLFTGNSASSWAGAIMVTSNPTASISNTLFTGNSSSYIGGVSMDQTGPYSITNCLFSGNVGGGLESRSNSVGTVTNVTFAENTRASINTVNDGCGAAQPQCLNVVNSILWGPADSEVVYNWPGYSFVPPSISYSDVQGGWTVNGTGNINSDPLFASGSRLGSGSPAIDAGNNFAAPEGMALDLDEHTRFVDDAAVSDTGNGTPPIIDMGAYEHASSGAPPVLTDVPASATIPELSPYTFDANATDSDIPPQTLTYSLIGAPSGASIDASTGVFAWTPTEAQGPGLYDFIVRVGDGAMNTDQAVSLTVTEVNAAPALGDVPSNATIVEFSPYTFDASATDTDVPVQPLTFSLEGAPSGASIDPSTGVFTWTPTEEEGGTGTPYTFTVRVADGVANTDQEVTLTVTELNLAPLLGEDAASTIVESGPWSYDAHATDPDVPQTLTYSLVGQPDGMTCDPATGLVSWTPAEAQGPGVYPFTVHVSDGEATDDQLITVTVEELNQAPIILRLPSAIAVPELVGVFLDVDASDADLPPQTLTFSLAEPYPAGMTIDAATGILHWMTTEADGPSSVGITIRVSDGLTETSRAMTWTVSEINTAPLLSGVPSSLEVTQTLLANFDADATDSDLPANTLTFSLVDAPAGAMIDPASGVFNWTPALDQSGAFTFTVRVSDGTGESNATADAELTIVVVALNKPPTLEGVPDAATIPEMQAYTFTAVATDDPLQTLVFSLIGAPDGATIDAASGIFTWTPTETQGPGSYGFTVLVTDGTETADRAVTLTVTEENLAPLVSGVPGSATRDELAEWSFTAAAMDSDDPVQTLTFSLVDAPAGATIDGTTGAFAWTPTDAQGPGTYSFTVRVTDGVANTDQAVSVTVEEINIPPVLSGVTSATFDELTVDSFDANATDDDPHAQPLTFSLIDAPSGASIDEATGVFAWTPTEAQGPGAYLFTVRVSDGVANTDQPIELTVREVNLAPDLEEVPASATIHESTPYSFDAGWSDGDVPPHEQMLTFALVGAPSGAAIDPSTGVFSWTPAEDQGPGSYPFSVQISDGVATHEHETTLTVTEINSPPVLDTIGPKSGAWNTLITFDANATDPDVPANKLTYTLSGAPAGASIDPTSGVFSWIPTSAQIGTYAVTVSVNDGIAPGGDSEIVSIEVTKRATTLTYTGVEVPQYSDPAWLSAVLSDFVNENPIGGATITFVLDTQTISGLTNASGVAAPVLLLDQAPGVKTVLASFAGNALYFGSADSDPYTVMPEQAVATYTGAVYVSTSCTTCTTATVTLAATIQDISAVVQWDPNGGDITHATVTFVDLDSHTDIATVPLDLVDPANTLTGTAVYNWNVDIAPMDQKDFTIGIRIGGWYAAAAVAETIVTVAKASLTDFVSGGGYVLIASSAGSKAADIGSKNNFGFGVKYNRKGKNLQGRFNTLFRRTEDGAIHRYQIKGSAMTSLAVQTTMPGGTATFIGKAVIQDVSDPLAPISVDGNATLKVTITDNGEPGSSDTIGITIFNKSGGIWYSSNWNGKKTTEKTLAAGNLVVH